MTNNGYVLIATHHLQEYAGSELITLELASEFRRRGWQVDVASFMAGDPLLSTLREKGFNVLDLVDDILSIAMKRYDLLWVHHLPVYYHLCVVNNINAYKIIHYCLSPFEPLEAPPLPNRRIDWILANSPETRRAIESKIGAGDVRLIVFPNFVPKNYWEHVKKNHSSSPQRIAIVSNHVPTEVAQTANKLKKSGIEIVYIGQGGRQELMTPELLAEFDLVITIGKTVQYCMAMCLPVYCYDHFGGPGWLNSENFEIAADKNFSGRGFDRKSCDLLVQEIVDGYETSLGNLQYLNTKASTLFDLSANLEELLCRPRTKAGDAEEKHDHEIIQQQHAYYLRILTITKGAAALRINHAQLGINYAQLESYVAELRKMWCWKITAPLRFIERAVRRWMT